MQSLLLGHAARLPKFFSPCQSAELARHWQLSHTCRPIMLCVGISVHLDCLRMSPDPLKLEASDLIHDFRLHMWMPSFRRGDWLGKCIFDALGFFACNHSPSTITSAKMAFLMTRAICVDTCFQTTLPWAKLNDHRGTQISLSFQYGISPKFMDIFSMYAY